MSLWGLSPEEDAELRRLHALMQYARVASELLQRYLVLRSRDRRVEVRPVAVDDLVQPQRDGARDEVVDDAEVYPRGQDAGAWRSRKA